MKRLFVTTEVRVELGGNEVRLPCRENVRRIKIKFQNSDSRQSNASRTIITVDVDSAENIQDSGEDNSSYLYLSIDGDVWVGPKVGEWDGYFRKHIEKKQVLVVPFALSRSRIRNILLDESFLNILPEIYSGYRHDSQKAEDAAAVSEPFDLRPCILSPEAQQALYRAGGLR